LARRGVREATEGQSDIRSPADVHRLVAAKLRDLMVEEFHLLAMDSQNRISRQVLITRGILNSSLVHPREVFRAAIAEAAAGVIVVHNHPSGNPAPSADDKAVTLQLVEAGRLLDIPVYDHLIVAGDRYFSFAERYWTSTLDSRMPCSSGAIGSISIWWSGPTVSVRQRTGGKNASRETTSCPIRWL
jgi:DNA repair protein RadC